MHTTRAFRALTVAAGAAVLAACTLGDPDGEGAAPAAGAAGGESAEHTFVAGTGTVPHLNPQIIVSPSIDMVTGGMYEALVRLTDTYEVVPWLARDWEIADGGRRVTLTLEEGVTWHDGEPFTAEDVVFNIEELVPYQAYGAGLVESIDTVEAPDDHTVVMTFAEPYGPVMEVLSLQRMLPKHLYEGTDYLDNPANMAPVGTGPFEFENFAEGQEISMRAYEDYWKGEVEVDRLIYVIQNDTNAGALSLIAGDTMVGGVGQGMLEQVRAAEHLELTQRGQLPRQFIFTMNADVPELQDPEVRRLVYQSVNRSQVAEVALPEISYEPTSMYPDELGWIDPGIDYREEFPYDPDAINARLDELGYGRDENGNRFSLRLHLMSMTAEARAVGAVIESSMAEVGIAVELVGEETNVFMENVYQRRDFDTAIVEATLGVDPSLGITRWYHCLSEPVDAENPSGICDEQLQEAVDAALQTTDQAERAEHFRTVQERAAEVMMAGPLVFHTPFSAYNSAEWEGLGSPDGLTGGADWTAVSPRE